MITLVVQAGWRLERVGRFRFRHDLSAAARGFALCAGAAATVSEPWIVPTTTSSQFGVKKRRQNRHLTTPEQHGAKWLVRSKKLGVA
jgi:hypothetical protein